jgi:iron complex transport system substrate-binding protein
LRRLLALLALAALPAAATVSAVDDLGRKVELPRAAQRIVTLAPFLTELVYSAGAGERLVGVSAHSDYPAEARGLPQVATAVSFSIEEVAALRPDLVLAWRDSARLEDLQRLEKLGIRTFVTQAVRLEDPARLLEAVGRLTGRDVAALAARYRERLASLRQRYAGRAVVPVFLEVWHNPLQTIGERHWISEALTLCGARNAFADLPGVAPRVSWEEVYRRDPPVVIGAGSKDGEERFRANWRIRETLSAVKARRLVFVDADTLQRPTLRLAEGVTQLCEGIDRAR